MGGQKKKKGSRVSFKKKGNGGGSKGGGGPRPKKEKIPAGNFEGGGRGEREKGKKKIRFILLRGGEFRGKGGKRETFKRKRSAVLNHAQERGRRGFYAGGRCH